MEQEVERRDTDPEVGQGSPASPGVSAVQAPEVAPGKAPESGDVPEIVAEELSLLRVVLSKLDTVERRAKVAVDDVGAMIELRDALAEAKPEDQGSLLEQMHRIEALSRQRGKGESPPVDRRSPYFGHMRLLERGRRRDVLIGQRGYVEPGGGVQIVDWRNAPVSRLFYRYEEGDSYEEQMGDRPVEGEILARRTVSISDAELRRVTSPQGTFARDFRSGEWREMNVRQARLSVFRDGKVTVETPAPLTEKPDKANRGRLGMEAGKTRVDRFLPAIAALIDPRQFELITRPSSGLIVVQGSAGSGKTTIGLHRIAYLAFADPRRFKPERMLVVVYQRALATYVSRVLPALDVAGVSVMTFAAWAEQVRRSTFPNLKADITEMTPSVVVRAKSHGAVLKILEDRQVRMATICRAELEAALAAYPREGQAALARWDSSAGRPVDQRVTSLARWVKESSYELPVRSAIEAIGAKLRSRTRDVLGEWAGFLTDRQAIGEGFERHAPGVFTPAQLDELHRWCSERERMRVSPDQEDRQAFALDVEDDALLLRIQQLQRGPLEGGKGPIAYEHLMVDEVQDFAPIELAVLLDSTTSHRSITLAGDTAQAIAPDHGFSTWAEMLDHLGIPHDRVEPLRVSYRSTREIVDAALHVLGPLVGDVRPVAPRSGAAVESFGFASAGEASEFLPQALKDLMQHEPDAAVAIIARHPEQARLYFEAFQAAEVPNLRLVHAQNFSFKPGIDVTDVRQTKGLEFDIVILVDVNEESYPENDHSRRLLHVAMTRAAHQLWITFTGAPSRLLPDSLRT